MLAYFLGVNNSSPGTGATNYGPVEGGDGAWQTVESAASQVIPHALTIDQLFVKLTTAPSTGKSWAFTLMVNGVASALTCTISDTATSASDVSHSVSLNAGDTVSLRAVPTGTPTATGTLSWKTRQSAASQFAILGGTVNAQTAATIIPPQGSQNVNASEALVLAPIPIPGTLKNLFVKVDAAPGGAGANAWTVKIRQNAADSALTVTVTDPATTGSDLVHTVSVAAGDRLAIGVTITGTPASARIAASYTVVPTTDGDACWMHSNANIPSTAAASYDVALGGVGAVWSATEAPRQHIAGQATLKALYARPNNNPGGGGKQYTVTVRDGGVATALSVVLAATGTVSITGQAVSVADLDLLAIESVPAATPFSVVIATGIAYAAVVGAFMAAPIEEPNKLSLGLKGMQAVKRAGLYCVGRVARPVLVEA